MRRLPSHLGREWAGWLARFVLPLKLNVIYATFYSEFGASRTAPGSFVVFYLLLLTCQRL